MTRNLSTAVQNAVDASTHKAHYLVKLEYDGGDVFACTAARTITYDGDDYLGVGNYGSVSAINEPSAMEPQQISVSLSGVAAAQISIAFNENFQGRPITVWRALLNSTYTLIADPVIVFKGKIDSQQIVLGSTGEITLTAVDLRADWNRKKVRRYNNEDQQAAYPGDLGLEFVEQTIEKRIYW